MGIDEKHTMVYYDIIKLKDEKEEVN